MQSELEPNTVLSHYRIVSKIGEGGMGEVYLAEDTKLERQVALKVLPAKVAADEERVIRFMQEAKAASALNHPNILTVFEIGNFEGSRYIATEFIKGETLRDRTRGGDLNLTEAIEIALQVAAALGAAHEAGIIHRDVKPENIMIRDGGLVKVLDFGLAKLTENRAETAEPEDATKAQFNTKPGLVMGTVAYMSPEQARGHKLDPRTDIFSLGIVLYELFTGRRPFDGEGHLDLISSILKDEPASLRQVSPGLPRQLERIVDKTLRKNRDQRYQHIKDLEIDLRDLRDELKFEAKLNQTTDQAVQAPITDTTQQRLTLTESISATRRFTLLHAFLFVLVGVGLIGAIWFFRSGKSGSVVPGSFKTSDIANWSSAPGELFSNANFSPDGKLIAFSSTKSGTKNIWVTQTASSEAIQVTNDGFSNKDPIWSPKGDEIAFFSQKGNAPDGRGNVTGVWRVSALGGTPRSVGAIADGAFELRRWTSAGKIYYQSQGDLFALDTATASSQKFTSFDPQNGKVTWVSISADEKSLAYVVTKDGGWQLFVSDAANAKPVKTAEGTGEIGGIAWLPEKGRFFYSALVDGVFQVFLIDGSATPARITASELDISVVDAAPDGRSIIVSSAKEESNIWRVNVSDGQEAPASRSVNSELWPAVSPSGERIVFQSAKNLSRGSNLFLSSIQVKSLKARDDNPTVLGERGFLPSWSPDGSAVAFLKKNGDLIELFTANPNGGGERLLASGGIPAIGYSVSPYNHIQTTAFSWSPDGGRIAYISNSNGAANVWTVSVRDGAVTLVTANTDTNYSYNCPIWSSDGKRLAFFSQKKTADASGKANRSLGIIDTESGTVSNFFESERIFRLIGWTADESGLIIAESEKASGLPPETILKRVATGNGTETTVARVKNAYYYNIFLSHDRKYVAFAARDQDKDDIWIVPSSGGEPRKLTNNNDSGLYFSRLSWLHDGSAIVFGKQTRFSLLSMINGID
ncbi:MAG: PD40 domain-containing protein [Acidobacteria bacterium]|nr:PD40 domain-containing protein [Acidobacteriota bacterium]